MDNKKIIGISILAVVLIVLGSQTSVVGYNSTKGLHENEYVDMTIQPCGIKGFGNKTVRLTRQQYENLSGYLEDFNARLNQTKTREDASPLFQEAVVELNKYGLLPKGMSVQKAQDFLYKQPSFTKLNQFFNKNSRQDNITNLCALTYANSFMVYKINIWILLGVLLCILNYSLIRLHPEIDN